MEDDGRESPVATMRDGKGRLDEPRQGEESTRASSPPREYFRQCFFSLRHHEDAAAHGPRPQTRRRRTLRGPSVQRCVGPACARARIHLVDQMDQLSRILLESRRNRQSSIMTCWHQLPRGCGACSHADLNHPVQRRTPIKSISCT